MAQGKWTIESTEGKANVIAPEEQLRNVAGHVLRYTERGDPLSKSNRKRRGQSWEHPGNVSLDATMDSARHLAEMILRYLDGSLEPRQDKGLPF